MSGLDVRLTPFGVSVSVVDASAFREAPIDPPHVQPDDNIIDDYPGDDTLADDPEAYSAYLDKWQHAVDRGEFCPTCGRDADHIVARGPVFNCLGCGDCWPHVPKV